MHARHHVFTLAEHRALEETSGVKFEFLAGQVFAMAGGSREHALFSANVIALLAAALRGKSCAVHSSDLRVSIEATGLRTYADATVLCGRAQLDRHDVAKQAVVNPKVLVEVLSPSTEDYDRGEKLGHYKTIPALREVMFVAHDRREVEIVRREKDGSWSRHVTGARGVARLDSIGASLSVRAIYRDPLSRRGR